MKTNKQEKIKLITKLVTQYKNLDQKFDCLYKLLGGDGESELFRAAWDIFDSYIDNTAILIGDSPEGLSWFIYDNDCGENKFTCEVNRKTVKIKDVKSYVEFLELDK